MEKKEKDRYIGLKVILVIVVILFGTYGIVSNKITRKIEEVLNGATVDMTYKLTLENDASDANRKAYNMLRKYKLAEGRIEGKSHGSRVYISVNPKNADKTFTDFYVDGSEAYLNIKFVYEYITDVILKDHELLSRLTPEWELDSYVKKSQLEKLMMKEDEKKQEITLPDSGIVLEDMISSFLISSIKSGDIKKIDFNDGNVPDYRYFSISSELTKGMDVVIGVLPSSLLKGEGQFHIIITDCERGLQLRLRGSLKAGNHKIDMPNDVMNDKAFDLYKDIRNIIDDIFSK